MGAVLDQGNVGRGAAHIEAERLRISGKRRHESRAGDTAGRAGQHCVYRRLAGALDAHDAAVGAHDIDAGLELDAAEFFLKAVQVPAHARPNVGVHDGDQRALVFAELRQDFRRQRHGHVWRDFLDNGFDPLFMLRVRVGVHQRDRYRFRAQFDQVADGLARRCLVERRDDLAARIHAFPDAAGQLEIGQRIRLLHDDPAGKRSRRLRARQMQNLLEVLGDQETDFGALCFQHDVGRHRRAVKERGDIGGGDAGFLDQLLDPFENPDRLIARRRRRFQKPHRTGAFVEQKQVRKSPADINAEPATHITPCVARFGTLFCAEACTNPSRRHSHRVRAIMTRKRARSTRPI